VSFWRGKRENVKEQRANEIGIEKESSEVGF